MFSLKSIVLYILCYKFIAQCQTSDQQNEITTIPVSQLLDELQRQSDTGLFKAHMTAMFSIATYGHRLYAVSKDISPECSQTAIAASAMLKNLTMGFQVMELLELVTGHVDKEDLNISINLQEHPLEMVCRKLDKYFGESPLKGVLEYAKSKAADMKISNSRPPYLSTLITSQEQLDSLQKEWYDYPEWAEEWVLISFYAQLDVYTSDPEMLNLVFAESVVRVARKEEFADSMQSIFLRAVKDVLPQITNSSSELRDEYFFWLPNLLKIFYSHIAEDPVLKKEVDNMAAIFSHGETTLDELTHPQMHFHSEL